MTEAADAASAADRAGAVRPDEQFDQTRLCAYLAEALPGTRGELEVQQFHGGHANLTYLLRFGGEDLVLRRPPLGPVAPRSHDMRREFKALSALSPLYPLAPRPVLLCEDESVIGAVFFVMERRSGVVVRHAWPKALGDDPEVRRRMSEGLVDALADLHAIDVARPEIAALGKPDGFVRRQVAGWQERWQRARTRDVAGMDDLAAWLLERVPESPHASVVHNDWKLDNAMFDAADPGRIVAVFDWDMTTLGDPLVDLGTLLGYWSDPGDAELRGTGGAVTSLPGFLRRAEIAERYARRSGTDLATLPFYETFALFKTAVVLEQIYVRFVRGQTQDERFRALGDLVPLLAEAASRLATGMRR